MLLSYLCRKFWIFFRTYICFSVDGWCVDSLATCSAILGESLLWMLVSALEDLWAYKAVVGDRYVFRYCVHETGIASAFCG